MLERFIALRGSADQAVEAFARHFGLLSLCSHLLPAEHEGVSVPARLAQPTITVGVDDRCRPGISEYEPMAVWRYWASQFGAVLDLAADLRRGRISDRRHWLTLSETGPWLPLVEWPAELTPDYDVRELGDAAVRQGLGARSTLAAILDVILQLGRVRLGISTKGGAFRSIVAGDGLFGALCVELAIGCAGGSRFRPCDGCQTEHQPPRPNSGKRSFCDKCRRDGVPQLQATRDYRARARLARRQVEP
jgi:hypothetical protein